MGEYKTDTMILDNAIIRVHIPNLTEEERKLRLSLIEKAAIDILNKGE